MTDLTGKHAIVTGGNRGIGAAIAAALAEAGATLTIMGRDSVKLNETANAIAARHAVAITALACDVSDEGSVTSAFRAAHDTHGTPFILVNNAGQSAAALLSETTRELWESMIAINLTGTFLCTKQVLAAMTAAGRGRIINIASTAGLRGATRISAYCAAKHGVVGFTRAVAMEVARTGITVNAVCPSYTESEMTDRTVAALAARKQITREQARQLIERTIPLGRLIRPEEVAATVLYLCSPGAAAITGQAIAVAGGETQ